VEKSPRLLESTREHRVFQTRVGVLHRLAAPEPPARPSPSRLQGALEKFLQTWGPRLGAHLDLEMRVLAGEAGERLPEAWSPDSFQRERETFETLFDLLRDGRAWLDRHEPGAEQEIAAALDDLALLWSQHIRRVDVIGPLLSSREVPGDA